MFVRPYVGVSDMHAGILSKPLKYHQFYFHHLVLTSFYTKRYAILRRRLVSDGGVECNGVGNKKLSCCRETARRFVSLNILLYYRSFIQTGTIWKLLCGFLFTFHSNYGSTLHHFRDKARYWSKIVIFYTSLHSTPPLMGSGHRRSIVIPFGTKKLQWSGYPRVKNFDGFDRIPACDGRTDGRTDRHVELCIGVERKKNAIFGK